MARQKKKKFAEVAKNPFVVEPGKPSYAKLAGKWNMDFFGRNSPLILELGCGRGEYTVGMARNYPDSNFLGIDVKGDRIWKGAREIQEYDLRNAGFLRTNIFNIEEHFAQNEVSEIWITFPDPRPKDRDEKHRMTQDKFLDKYRLILKPGGKVHLKTDNTFFFDYSLEVLANRADIEQLKYTDDLYASNYLDERHRIKTRYEGIFTAKGEKIKYLSFIFTV